MGHLIKCTDIKCPWKKECIRYIPPSKVIKNKALFISPRTSEGCTEFLNEDERDKYDEDE